MPIAVVSRTFATTIPVTQPEAIPGTPFTGQVVRPLKCAIHRDLEKLSLTYNIMRCFF